VPAGKIVRKYFTSSNTVAFREKYMIKADALNLRAAVVPLTLAAGSFVVLSSQTVSAGPTASSRNAKTKRATTVKVVPVAASKATAKSTGARKLSPLPRYLPLEQIKMYQKAKSNLDWGSLNPLLNGAPLPKTMQNLPGAEPVPGVWPLPKLTAKTAKTRSNAQRFPRPAPPGLAPAPIRRTAPAVPRWVRYPLEFQLAGIGIGTRAVDKDRFNRIDRYGLFAMHGNPTAVVVPSVVTGGTTGPGISVQQQPPEVAALFPGSRGGGLPDWASAITVSLDNNHVQWLYNRETFSMGFVVDRLGFVDAIVVAGTSSPIARTQLEDPVHTIKLGDDLRKVLFRYGYPDTIETYTVSVAGAGVGAPPAAGGAGGEGSAPGGPPGGQGGPPPGYGGAPGGASGGPPGSQGGPPGADGAGGAGAAQAMNNAYRTFELRYEQSYNVVFTIRNNRVVRIYIFGDPDFFNDRRRRLFRASY
jgi:hypothetical protein